MYNECAISITYHSSKYLEINMSSLFSEIIQPCSVQIAFNGYILNFNLVCAKIFINCVYRYKKIITS